MSDLIDLALITVGSEHKYCLASVNTRLKDRIYNTRYEAERAMRKYCFKNGIKLECVDDSKHCKMYEDHNNVQFFINRLY